MDARHNEPRIHTQRGPIHAKERPEPNPAPSAVIGKLYAQNVQLIENFPITIPFEPFTDPLHPWTIRSGMRSLSGAGTASDHGLVVDHDGDYVMGCTLEIEPDPSGIRELDIVVESPPVVYYEGGFPYAGPSGIVAHRRQYAPTATPDPWPWPNPLLYSELGDNDNDEFWTPMTATGFRSLYEGSIIRARAELRPLIVAGTVGPLDAHATLWAYRVGPPTGIPMFDPGPGGS